MVAQIKSEVMQISDPVDSRDAKSTKLTDHAAVKKTQLTTSNNLTTVNLASPWVRAAQLPELFCSWDLAYRCTKGGWLKPIVQGKRRTIYRLADVLICMQRIEAGELPLSRRNKATL
jgi:hypothetical protein